MARGILVCMSALRVLLGVALLALVGMGPRAVEADSSWNRASLAGQKALEVLSSTDVFADPYVGFAGSPSREACAFRTILDQPDADRLFRRLLARAHLPGRLYALCGLYFTDHDRFLRVIQPYRESPDSVATFQGCFYGREGVAKLVESSHPRAIRLRDPTETTAEWLERNKDPSGSQDFVFDILGGGWPARFKEMNACDGR